MSDSLFIADVSGHTSGVCELHTNIWVFNPRQVALELGLLFELNNQLPEAEDLRFNCITPFPIKRNSALCLSNRLTQDDTYLSLLLNKRHVLKKQEEDGIVVRYVDFPHEKAAWMILPLQFEATSNDCLQLKSTLSTLARRIIQEKRAKQETVRLYTRLRYRIDFGMVCGTIVINTGLIHHGMVFDFRVNEIRSLRASPPPLPFSAVRQLRLFLVQPTSYKVVLDGNATSRAYVRVLERQWLEYADRVCRQRLMVYSWAMDSADSYHLLLWTEQIRFNRKVLLWLALFIALLIALAEYGEVLGALVPPLNKFLLWLADRVIGHLVEAFAALGFIMTWFIGHALWDALLHDWWDTLLRKAVASLGPYLSKVRDAFKRVFDRGNA